MKKIILLFAFASVLGACALSPPPTKESVRLPTATVNESGDTEICGTIFVERAGPAEKQGVFLIFENGAKTKVPVKTGYWSNAPQVLAVRQKIVDSLRADEGKRACITGFGVETADPGYEFVAFSRTK